MPSDLKTDLVESTLAGAAWDEYINAMGKILSYLYHALPEKDVRALASEASSAGFVLASRMYQAGLREGTSSALHNEIKV